MMMNWIFKKINMEQEKITSLKQNNISTIITDSQCNADPFSRDASFDYCYNYFFQNRLTKIEDFDMEKGCLMLWYYLSSWGMLRNSKLLSRSSKHLEPLIEYILSDEVKGIFEIDIDKYNETNIEHLILIYNNIRERVVVDEKQTHLTLVTKIMLGVFGCVPAFDTYFILGMSKISASSKIKNSFTAFNKKSLEFLKEFYEANQFEIDKFHQNTHTIDYHSKQKSQINYTRAKIVDLYGFETGFLSEQKKQ